MNATVLVAAQLELPSLEVTELALESETVRLRGSAPVVRVTAKVSAMCGAHFLPGELANVLEPIEKLAEVGRVLVAEPELAMACLEVLE